MREFHRSEPIDRVVRSKRPSPSGKLLIAYGVRTQETLAAAIGKAWTPAHYFGLPNEPGVGRLAVA